MKKVLFITLLAFIGNSSVELNAQSHKNKILVFYKTALYKHASIPAGVAGIRKLAVENRIQADTSSNAELFTKDNLKNYDAVVFLSTSGDMLNDEQQEAFENYIHNGGGFMGIHGASAGEYDWPWYGKLLGAVFDGHPKQQYANFKIIDKKNQATRHLPETWHIMEELYNFKNISPDIHVLITVDESSYIGGKNGDFHPMAWYQNFESGRSFYTALGHADEKYSEPLFLKHILEGIRFAMGK